MALHIEDYALIGDLRTAALVGVDGAIDWLPLPRFDSPAVLAALLGDARHGQWILAPADRERCSRRRYRADTLVLETEWTTGTGAVRVTDLMVPGSSEPMVMRSWTAWSARLPCVLTSHPAWVTARKVPTLRTASGQLVATVGCEDLWLDSDVDLTTGCWTGAFTVTAGQGVTFTLAYTAGEPRRPDPDADGALAATIAFWTDWRSRSTYTGPWAAEVNQSLIILKALTYAPAGSILAAATTSLPEWLGGSRN